MIFEQPPKLLEHKLLEPNYFINELLDFFFFWPRDAIRKLLRQ